MRIAVNKITSLLLRNLLLLSFVLLLVNNAVFYHSHVLANGQVVSHAHPYNKSSDKDPIKTHHHSNAEFLFLDLVQLLFFLFLTGIGLAVFSQKAPHFRKKEELHPFGFFLNTRNRAPPFTV
jgi:hypothetical protein